MGDFYMVDASFIRSTSGYVTTSPAKLDSIAVAHGSAAGTFTFRDGSTGGTIRTVWRNAAAADTARTASSPNLPGAGIIYSTAVYLVITGGGSAKKPIVTGGYRGYRN